MEVPNFENSGAQRSVSDSEIRERAIDVNGDGSVSLAIVNAVASITEQEATKMEPLSGVIDTDSLEELFQPTDRSPRNRGVIEFEYSGCLVRVSADGRLGIVPPGNW